MRATGSMSVAAKNVFELAQHPVGVAQAGGKLGA